MRDRNYEELVAIGEEIGSGTDFFFDDDELYYRNDLLGKKYFHYTEDMDKYEFINKMKKEIEKAYKKKLRKETLMPRYIRETLENFVEYMGYVPEISYDNGAYYFRIEEDDCKKHEVVSFASSLKNCVTIDRKLKESGFYEFAESLGWTIKKSLYFIQLIFCPGVGEIVNTRRTCKYFIFIMDFMKKNNYIDFIGLGWLYRFIKKNGDFDNYEYKNGKFEQY